MVLVRSTGAAFSPTVPRVSNPWLCVLAQSFQRVSRNTGWIPVSRNVESPHRLLVIPLACGGAFRHHRVETIEIALREVHAKRAGVLFQVLEPLRSRDRHDVLALRQHPR